MQKLSNTKTYKNNVNNVSKYITNNDINVNTNKKKYMLDKTKFKPNTEATELAEEISKKLKDPNYAGFLAVVNKIGCSEARRLLKNVLSDISDKKQTKTPVRNPGAYFIWKYRNHMY